MKAAKKVIAFCFVSQESFSEVLHFLKTIQKQFQISPEKTQGKKYPYQMLQKILQAFALL